MHITELLDPDRIACRQSCASKKRALEKLSQLLGAATPALTEGEIFDALVGRERLGSTGLGKGVALPHGRMPGLAQPLGAVLVLEEGVDFDAVDQQPVDILFALLVPEESTDEHLQILARLAELFSDPEFCRQLRACPDAETGYRLFVQRESHPLSA